MPFDSFLKNYENTAFIQTWKNVDFIKMKSDF